MSECGQSDSLVVRERDYWRSEAHKNSDEACAARAETIVLERARDKAIRERDEALRERDIARADAEGCRKAWTSILTTLERDEARNVARRVVRSANVRSCGCYLSVLGDLEDQYDWLREAGTR